MNKLSSWISKNEIQYPLIQNNEEWNFLKNKQIRLVHQKKQTFKTRQHK